MFEISTWFVTIESLEDKNIARKSENVFLSYYRLYSFPGIFDIVHISFKMLVIIIFFRVAYEKFPLFVDLLNW